MLYAEAALVGSVEAADSDDGATEKATAEETQLNQATNETTFIIQ